jgi:hypothetical protein
MILFLNEDRAYLSWVTHHRHGFVLDCNRKPTKHHLILHRATCPDVKHSASRTTHWTTGHHMKACSLDAEELRVWANDETGAEPNGCVSCLVAQGQPSSDEPLHLTKLDHEILSFVLEVAMLHLDQQSGVYWLNVGMVAKCLDKTPAQLNAAVSRLVLDGLLMVTDKWKPGDPLPSKCELLPTVLAMKTLSAYQDRTEEEIEADVRALADDDTRTEQE